MKENGFILKKADDTSTQTTQMTSHFLQVNLPKLNPCCIVWSRQQVTLASMWMQTKRSICVLNKKENISNLNSGSLKLVDKFIYLGSSGSSIENDINMDLAKAWTAINRLSIIWKSDLSNKIKHNFFQAAVVSILVCGCTSRKQHPTKQQLYSHWPLISKSIQIRWTRHARHCWRSKDKLMWCSPMDAFTQMYKCELTNKNLSTTALYRYKM